MASFLVKYGAEFGKPMIIELGTSLGISTMYMAASCPDATVYTIEGCHATAAIAKQNFTEAGLNNINIILKVRLMKFCQVLKTGIKPGMVFIDGNHRKEPVIKYFNMMAEISGEDTVIIIDDINYSRKWQKHGTK